MKRHLNTLFVTTDGTFVGKDGEALVVKPPQDGERVRVPIHMLHAVVCLARVTVSPPAMALCVESGVSISHHRSTGKLLARVVGFTPGNVLLRREQFRSSEDPEVARRYSISFIQGKLHNTRVLVRRAVRDHGDEDGKLGAVGEALARALRKVEFATTLDQARGIEGDAAKAYWNGFDGLLHPSDDRLRMNGRSRRPPRDPVNAMLSFSYAMLASDARSAAESVGLDSQVGFLHTLRAGRPALALDLMEELRPVLADRVVLSVLNRGQLTGSDFLYEPGGAVQMKDGARKTFLKEYQRRKEEELKHPYLGERVTLGMVPFVQARLLGKALRGEIDSYPPFLWR